MHVNWQVSTLNWRILIDSTHLVSNSIGETKNRKQPFKKKCFER